MTTHDTKAPASNGTRMLVIGVLIVAAFFGAYKFAAALSAPAGQPGATAGLPGTQVAGGPPAAGGGGSCCGGGGGAPSGGAAPAPSTGAVVDASAGGASATGGASGGGGCCGGGGPDVTGEAKVSGDVQTISVDLSGGGYNPNTIKLKAGVPAEITFGQGSGCLGQLLINDFGIYEDLTTGPKTVKLPALEKGTYAFSCGMQMVFGKIVVE